MFEKDGGKYKSAGPPDICPFTPGTVNTPSGVRFEIPVCAPPQAKLMLWAVTSVAARDGVKLTPYTVARRSTQTGPLENRPLK